MEDPKDPKDGPMYVTHQQLVGLAIEASREETAGILDEIAARIAHDAARIRDPSLEPDPKVPRPRFVLAALPQPGGATPQEARVFFDGQHPMESLGLAEILKSKITAWWISLEEHGRLKTGQAIMERKLRGGGLDS